MNEDIPFLIELPIPNVHREEACRIADMLVGSPVFVCKTTRKIAAYIETIAVQNNMFICEITFSDEDLLNNIDDMPWVLANYDEVETIEAVFGPLH